MCSLLDPSLFCGGVGLALVLFQTLGTVHVPYWGSENETSLACDTNLQTRCASLQGREVFGGEQCSTGMQLAG